MTITVAQKAAIEEVIEIITATTPSRGKRLLSQLFLTLVDRTEWPEYYEVIPEPRCINGIKANIEKNRYKDPLNAYTDLSLVFWNALFYNEPESQIATDAQTLKNVLETEWRKRTILPVPRTSPPPSSAQKVHGMAPTAPPQPNVVQPSNFTMTKSRTATTSAQSSVPSTSELQITKSTPLNPSQHLSSPDIEIDVSGMTPDPESHTEDIIMGSATGEEIEGDSEAIIRQLEKSLPRWQGFGELGWMSEVSKDRLVELVLAIESHKDVAGNRLAAAIEAVPEEPTSTDLSYLSPLSLKSIVGRAKSRDYESSKDFDLDMARLFEKARRFHTPCTELYGRVLVLQRLYQAITSSTPPSGPPYSSTPNFASIQAGPGTARPVHSVDSGVAGVTAFRVSTKLRTFVDELHYKGWTIRLADWLHLSNPDDPSRPIIGQVFKCWKSDEFTKKGQPGLSVCWYYRPEQTFHPAHTQFMDKEVFKTGLFVDHALEDVIEKIACQFTARHIRGRPRPPFWYPGWPLYVCHSRYNDRERLFVKIKNWSSCVPEEVRKNEDFMPIYPFERLVYPPKIGSPFVGTNAVKGPGGIGEPIERAQGEKIEGGGTGRKRAKRNVESEAMTNSGVDRNTPAPIASTAAYSQYSSAQHSPPKSHTQEDARDRTMLAAAGTLTVPPIVDKLPSETTKHFDRSPDTNELLWFAAPPMNVARTPPPRHSLAYLHFLAMKRKNELAVDSDTIDIDGGAPSTEPSKRQRTVAPPTISEILQATLNSACTEHL